MVEEKEKTSEDEQSVDNSVSKGDEDQKEKIDISRMKWYVVHTYSGYEENVKLALEQRIKKHKLQKYFGEIFIPSETVEPSTKPKKEGQEKKKKQKFFPGYILVQMEMNKDTWHLVRKTPRVTGFVGNQQSPTPLPEEDVKKLRQQIEDGELKPRVAIDVDDEVRVIEGPFMNFTGKVVSVNPERGRLTVEVSIFGRRTPVELDFSQVEKIS